MKRTLIPTPVRRTVSLSRRSWIGAAAMAGTALILLSIHVFAPIRGLQASGLCTLGFALLAAWIAVLSWRMPVFDRGTIVLFGAFWIAGLALSIVCVQQSAGMLEDPALRRSAQWLALTLSLAVGALFLRALLRRRTTSLVARLLSLLSPLVILLLILFSSPAT